jgi:hypothetical protein
LAVLLSLDLDGVEMSFHAGYEKCVRGAFLFVEVDGGHVVDYTEL